MPDVIFNYTDKKSNSYNETTEVTKKTIYSNV